MHFYHLLRVVQPCIHQLLLLLTLLATAAQVFADIPDEPEQLRYSVYSDTSAEIMWRRASNEAAVVAYEIKQNGEIIETRDTLSYFTNDPPTTWKKNKL